MKYLLLVFLMGLSTAAHALTGTSAPVDIPVTITGATVPAPAQAAGFMTTVIDYDFTQSNPWSNTSNWLRCHDGSGAANPILYQDWLNFGGFQMPTCSNITWGTDPLGGNALHFHMDLASYQAMPCYPNCNGVGVAAMMLQTMDSNGNGNKVPTNSYFEVTSLIKTTDPTMSQVFVDHWSYSTINSGVEWDGIEWFGSNTGFSTFHNNSCTLCSTNERDILDTSAYHKYAWRVTQDGVSNGFFCSYKDDQPAASSPGNCISWLPSAGQLADESTSTVQFVEMGIAACSGGCPNTNLDVYVKRLRVFSCAPLNSGARCLTLNPNP